MGLRYTDVYLVFDLDIQDKAADVEKIKTLLQFFNDSSGNGKLYLNYPMMESYKHMSFPNDPDFENLTVPIGDLSDYKRIVSEYCCNDMVDVRHYDRPMFMKLLAAHMKKNNKIITGCDCRMSGGRYEIPDVGSFFEWDGIRTFDREMESKSSLSEIIVLNTCIFNIVEYNPTDIIAELTELEHER